MVWVSNDGVTQINSTGAALTILFVSDSSGAFRGFQLEYQEIARGRLGVVFLFFILLTLPTQFLEKRKKYKIVFLFHFFCISLRLMPVQLRFFLSFCRFYCSHFD